MRDFGAADLAGIHTIRSRFLELAEIFDFELIEPSPIEATSTLEAKSGPAIRDEIYFFKDKGGRDVALRFDFTVGLTRHVASQRSLRMPARFASFGGVFRYDEPQKGRYRYFHQWNVETYGRSDVESEAEVIEFTARLFESLGLEDTIIDISHRGLVESRISEVFGSNEPALIVDVLRAMDKAAKRPHQEILDEFAKRNRDPKGLEEMLEMSSVAGLPKDVEEQLDVAGLDSWDHLTTLFESLHNRDVRNARINLAIVRGLDYYSGTVFEVFDTSSAAALAGGGRYDGLARAFGRDDLGAVGVAGGVERTMLAMRSRGMAPAPQHPETAILYTEQSMRSEAVKIASTLRRKRIPVRIDLSKRPLRKQISHASDSKRAVIVGPAEIRKGMVILRDMEARTESQVPLKTLLSEPVASLRLQRPE